MMVNPDQLESVIEAFRQWRSSRSIGGKTPQPLRQQAAKLLEYYPAAQVAKALGTNNGTLRRWWGEINNEPIHNPPIAQNFISLLGAQTPPQPEPTAVLQVTLENSHGTRLTVNGDMSPQHLAALAASLASHGGAP